MCKLFPLLFFIPLFAASLPGVQIAPPTDEHAIIAEVDTMTFDLNLMKSLEVLLIESVQVSQLEARYSLPKQLLKLEVRRSLKFLQVGDLCG